MRVAELGGAVGGCAGTDNNLKLLTCDGIPADKPTE